MGWTFTHKPKGMPVGEFFTSKGALSWSENDKFTARVLDSALVGLREFYAAVEFVHKPDNRREVWAAVFLIKFVKDDYNFGYKDLTEHMGPTIANCPQRILELLTTTTSENALEWRAKCWKRVNSLNAIPSLKKGVRFSLAAPMGFQNGDKVKDFVVLGSRGSRLMLADQRFPTDTRYRVPRTMLNQYVFAGKVTFNDSGLLAAPIEQTSAKPSLFK